MKKSKQKYYLGPIILVLFLFSFINPVFAAQTTITDQTKYIDKYFEIDKDGHWKMNIYLGDQILATVDDTGTTTFPLTDHLGSPTIITNQNGNIVETNEYDSFGNIIYTTSTIKSSDKFTGKKLDSESNLQYYGARYLDNQLARFISVDPAILTLHDGQKLKKITRNELQQLLSNPQNLNSYAYSVNNPIIYVDQNGEFYGQFGRDMASGQRQISSFLHNAAGYTSSRGGFFDRVSGWVTDNIGDFVDNVANIYDPDQGASTRVFALGMVVLDTSTGGEGKVAGRILPELRIGKVTKAVKELDVATRAIKEVKDISGFTREGLNQIINRGIKPEMIKDTISNTLRYVHRIDEIGRDSYRYIGQKAVLNFNKAGELITGWLK